MKQCNLIFLILFLATSCAIKEKRNQTNLAKTWQNHISKSFDETGSIKVLVVTNRQSKGDQFSCHQDKFGVELASNLSFGVCDINVPKNHAIGEINFSTDLLKHPKDYFKIKNSTHLTQSQLFKFVKDSQRAPLVFVHGFNVDYREAVLRTAQIAYDLKYQGPVILFSWPSGASEGIFGNKFPIKTYEENLITAKRSIKLFSQFLMELSKSKIKANVIVHSMGHQVALPALKQIGKNGLRKSIIRNLILNAPDFDVNEFKLLVANIKKTSNNINIYCSANDKAISASKTFNGGKRLGACDFASRHADVINVDLVNDASLLGHSYYSSRAILNDVFQTFLGIETRKRLFISRDKEAGMNKYIMRR